MVDMDVRRMGSKTGYGAKCKLIRFMDISRITG